MLSTTCRNYPYGNEPPPTTSHITNNPYKNSQIMSRSNDKSNNLFSGFVRKISRRGSNTLFQRDTQTTAAPARSSYLSPPNTNPYSQGSSPTRRPGRSGATPNDPPPAYSAVAYNTGSANRSPSAAPSIASTADDQYAFLRSFDTIFLIDDSGSMAGRCWRETAEALKTIAPICTQHDADGIDIYFLNHPNYMKNVKLAGTVVEIFQTVRPGGATPTGQRLNKILKPYLAEYEARPETTKPINIIVITDGEPTDDVESPIIATAKKLDRLEAPSWQVGIQFFQVGSAPEARDHLKQLDDGLRETANDPDLRDIVDTIPFTGAGGAGLTGTGVLKCVLGSVNRRLDRNSKELHRR